MALRIETFDNVRGGNTLYKALTHPSAAGAGQALVDALSRNAPEAVYDPNGQPKPSTISSASSRSKSPAPMFSKWLGSEPRSLAIQQSR